MAALSPTYALSPTALWKISLKKYYLGLEQLDFDAYIYLFLIVKTRFNA